MQFYLIRPYFEKWLDPLAAFFIKRKTSPNKINLTALIVSFIIGALLYYHPFSKWLLLAVPLLIFIRLVLNTLDSIVARGLGLYNKRGEVINEFFNRLSDLVIFTGFALSFITEASLVDSRLSGQVTLLIGFIFIILMQLNSFLGILNKAIGGNRIYSGILGKFDRMFYLAVAVLIYFFYSYDIVWNVFTLFGIAGITISVIQRLWVLFKA